MRSVWLCSRNDCIGNLAIILVTLGVFGTGSGWSDLVVAVLMGGLGVTAARYGITHARSEMPSFAAPVTIEMQRR